MFLETSRSPRSFQENYKVKINFIVILKHYLPFSLCCLLSDHSEAMMDKIVNALIQIKAVEPEGINIAPPPPKNMPLWHKDYFDLKATKNQQMKEEFFVFPLAPKSRASISLRDGVSPSSRKGRAILITGDGR